MRVFLSGFMAAGKSSVGRALALELKLPFHDLDERIAEQVGKPVGEIFASHGEAGFRRFEVEALEGLLGHERCVVALGGGTVLSDSNRRRLREAGFLVWLNTPRSTILARLAEAAGDRPLFEDGEQAARLFEARAKAYRDCDLEVRPEPEETVAETALRIAEQVK